MASVELGFAEKCDESWKLYSHYYPSKLGGAPAWLALDQLPKEETLSCEGCQEPVKFLLQIYSPDDQQDYTFHRTIFLFACSKAGCSNRSFSCFRSQLQVRNKFYSSSPPNEDFFDGNDVYPTVNQFSSICCVCNCLGAKKCSSCKTAIYCSVTHQRWHWRKGHKQRCSSKNEETGCPLLRDEVFHFPEYEIVIEPEKSEAERLEIEENESRALLEKTRISEESTSDNSSDWSNQKMKITDSQFLKFKERINSDPEQIIRYDRGGHPLLVNKESINNDEIPPCERCGAPRTFEFQVLPQTLSYLNLQSSVTEDTLDWGTLLIHTCSNSCDITTEDGGGIYAKEYVYRQMLSDEDVVQVDR